MSKRDNPNPNWLIQLIWFVVVGWWAGQLAIILAWAAMATIIGIPIGLVIINNLSRIIALRQPEHKLDNLRGQPQRQVNFIIRFVYFILIGWWASGIWIQLGYFLCITIIGMPIGFEMFDRAAGVMSLKR